jgi:uncharacterized protein YceH (UPF0502 family)
MSLSPEEARVLGCLLEKERTTPDAYPLSMNALVAACNQSTNRSPVVSYGEETVETALDALRERGFVRRGVYPGSRVIKYKHVLDEALALGAPELALVGVLLLRGPQTPGELKQRVERLYPFGSLPEVEETLQDLIVRELVARLPRRPGQKEERYVQLLGGDEAPEPAAVPETRTSSSLEERVARLEAKLRELEARLASAGLDSG